MTFTENFTKEFRIFCRTYCKKCLNAKEAKDNCNVLALDAWLLEKYETKRGYANRREEMAVELFS